MSNDMAEIMKCFMKTKIMRIVSPLVSIVWKKLCKYSPPELEKAVMTSLECLTEAKTKMIDYLIELILSFCMFSMMYQLPDFGRVVASTMSNFSVVIDDISIVGSLIEVMAVIEAVIEVDF